MIVQHIYVDFLEIEPLLNVFKNQNVNFLCSDCIYFFFKIICYIQLVLFNHLKMLPSALQVLVNWWPSLC